MSSAAADVEKGESLADDLRSGKTFGRDGGLRITFKDLAYHVPSNTDKKERAYLLKGVSGWFEPHQMAALMGPSGSGKTTLLDVLAGRKNQGVIEGDLQFGGQKPSQQFLRRYTGYVEQFDTLIGILTVEEMLMYTAELKRSTSEPLAVKRDKVAEVLKKLALEGCRDVKIGNPLMKGISGGQAKRTNIGIALVTNPRVLFLDEPTSGLDSYTSNEVMTVVKKLVDDGTTICATIHSPTQYCFNLFDRLIMLVRGRVVYFGAAQGGARFAIEACPKVKQMSAGYNEAEFLVDLVTEADRQGKGAVIADNYDSSQLKRDNDAQLAHYMGEKHEALPEHIQKELAVKSSTVTPWWWGLKTLVKYRTSRNYQNPEFLGPRIGDKIFMGLLVMTLYLGIGDDFDPSNYINISAVLFMWVTLPAFGAAAYVPSLVLERNLFTRERNDGLYHVITYLLAKMVDELFLAAVASVGIAAFVFYGVRLQGNFACFWLVYYVTLCNGISLAYFIAAISPNLDVANALLPTYVVTLLFFAGFLFRLDDIPNYWKWYSYIDFMRYSFGAVMVNQFDEVDPPFQGTTVLGSFNMDGVDKWNYLGFLAIFFGVFFSLAWLVMSVKKYQTR
eukprot:CAMPEP_0202901782 /NCGR_PEP_ID=MMETSP1392-20130828/14649_1 /ASSEMBLY_ACC=CAM_ASM_000868 /TAXON_ID=225041 /ORGANISM="Chlamydomonas chlamydogama, Strain SAG 11-48b" /LENGTH=615 /DNA_ID=CAMNT_0049588397 /DNA_START=85 /DNA_END=1932 /DNA_ORIENTATION=+